MKRVDLEDGERAYMFGGKESDLAKNLKLAVEALNFVKSLTGPPLRFLNESYSKLLKREVHSIWIAIDKEGAVLGITTSLEENVAPVVKAMETALARMKEVEKKEQN